MGGPKSTKNDQGTHLTARPAAPNRIHDRGNRARGHRMPTGHARFSAIARLVG
jgi:hypothetical protein